jgi:hypothetical protein
LIIIILASGHQYLSWKIINREVLQTNFESHIPEVTGLKPSDIHSASDTGTDASSSNSQV